MSESVLHAWNRLEVRNDLRGPFEDMGMAIIGSGPFEFTSEHCNRVTALIQEFHDTRADWRRDEHSPQWINWDLAIDLHETTRLTIQTALVKEFPKVKWWNWYGYKTVTTIKRARAHNEFLQS
jgi:hypothetical protein